MTAPLNPVLLLVPGDDWAEQIAVTDENGDPVDLTGWSVTQFQVTWRGGAIALNADLSQAAAGIVTFNAADSETATLPPGLQSTITLKMRSPTGIDETLYVGGVKGIDIATRNQAAATLSGIQEPPGLSFHVVGTAIELTPELGHDGDTAIVRDTGAEHRKSAGSWAPTGASFWGTLLIEPALGSNLTTNGYWLSGDGGDEGVFIDADGDVGVGTPTPAGRLHLAGPSTEAAQLLTLQTTNVGQGNGAIRWQGQAGANQAFIGSYFNVGDLGNLELGNQGTTRLIIRSNGDVGIGTYYPSSKLHVEGPVRLGQFTVATVPDASVIGAGVLIFVSNESGGAVIAFSDGTDWRRLTDRAVIS